MSRNKLSLKERKHTQIHTQQYTLSIAFTCNEYNFSPSYTMLSKKVFYDSVCPSNLFVVYVILCYNQKNKQQQQQNRRIDHHTRKVGCLS